MSRVNPEVPQPIGQLADRLAQGGGNSWLVGETVASLLCGHRPHVWQLAVTLSFDELLCCLPRAVAIRPSEAVALVATPAGPVDVIALGSRSLEASLASRCFRRDALALEARSGELFDPHRALADFESDALRCLGGASERLASDPVQALGAARRCAQANLQPDSELAAAMAATRLPLSGKPLARVRRALIALLTADGVENGLRVLRATGLEAQLARDVRADAGPIAARTPATLERRLVAWLRAARASQALRRMRFGRGVSDRVLLLLDHHPFDAARTEVAAQRLLRRLGPGDRSFLLGLREHELELAGPEDAAAGRKSLERAHEAIERAEWRERCEHARESLVLKGDDVMSHLACGPGRRVGRALRHLAELVARDAGRNRRESLLHALDEWAAQNPS